MKKKIILIIITCIFKTKPKGVIAAKKTGLEKERNITIKTPADVEGSDSNSIASNNEAVVAGIQQHKREHAIQHVHTILPKLFILNEIMKNSYYSNFLMQTKMYMHII